MYMDTSKLKEMRKHVKEELEHIPKGNFPQNQLRQVYWMTRMHSLGKNSQNTDTKEDVLRTSVVFVKKDYPDFVPQYDTDFFSVKL